ncbi:MAG: response regulator transcription factor [Bacteroidetes bacterium]|nr:response regulator transcription factor [Bacteroidota bacterium]HET6243169.1 LytTR family DNA-binding domain-containing protein [Bacteroidia bacterium]
MTCVILEDDSMARKLLEQMVNDTESLELIKSFSSSVECYKFLMVNKVDLIFLDVEMPEMSGLEMISNLPTEPLVIFTTGNKDYAINSFDHRVVDYLVKPFSYVRILKAVMKAEGILNTGTASVTIEKNEKDANHLFIKQAGQYIKLPFSDILYIEALGDYINIHVQEKKYIIHETMKSFLGRLPQNFLRVHRSFVVNTNLITSIEDNTIYIQKKAIPVGVSYRESVYKSLKLS